MTTEEMLTEARELSEQSLNSMLDMLTKANDAPERLAVLRHERNRRDGRVSWWA